MAKSKNEPVVTGKEETTTPKSSTLASIAQGVEPTPVLIAPQQPPVPVVITAPDGVTPVPVPSLGAEANTAPGEFSPVAGYISEGQAPAIAPPALEGSTPVNVTVISPAPPLATVIKGEGVTLTPTTTEEEDATTAGQRKVNLIWEDTQRWIALMVVGAGVFINSVIIIIVVLLNKEVSTTQLALISISLQFINLTTGIVIGFYFSRTNHTAKSGIGPQKEYPYTGR